eukprot:5759783-Prymnesium_polylepis.2
MDTDMDMDMGTWTWGRTWTWARTWARTWTWAWAWPWPWLPAWWSHRVATRSLSRRSRGGGGTCEKTMALADGSRSLIRCTSSRRASILVELWKRARSMRLRMPRRAWPAAVTPPAAIGGASDQDSAGRAQRQSRHRRHSGESAVTVAPQKAQRGERSD